MINKNYFVLVAIIIVLLSGASYACNTNDTSVIDDDTQDLSNQESHGSTSISKENVKPKSAATTVTKNVSTFEDFQETITSKNHTTINLTSKYYSIESNTTVLRDVHMVINGNNAVFDGNGIHSFLNYGGLSLTINDLTIQNCFSINIGALTISKKPNVVLNNCTFRDNIGTYKGGAITNRQNLTVNNCHFIHNTAKQGANIWSTGNYNHLTIENSYFSNNDTRADEIYQENEGAIYVTNPHKVTIRNSTFDNSTGCVIHGYLDSDVDIRNCSFTNINIKSPIGLRGSLINNYEADMKISQCKFNNIYIEANKVTGGVIYHEIGKFELTSNNFTNTKVNVKGNTLDNRLAGTVLWNRNATSTIKDNTFNVDITAYHTDGGVLYNNIGNLTVINNTFNVKATTTYRLRGGAMFNDYDEEIGIKSNLLHGYNKYNINTEKSPNVWNEAIYSPGNNEALVKIAYMNVTNNASVDTGCNVTFNINVVDQENVPLTGTAIIKLAGITLKWSNGTQILLRVFNGKANLTFNLAGFSAKTYTVTAVFSKKDYSRCEAYSTLTVNKGNYSIDPPTFSTTSEGKVKITLKIMDSHGQQVRGITKIAFKISNKTVANTQVENGALYIEFKIPYLPAREHELSILLGENYRYNYMKVNSTCTIYKQNVSVRISEVKSKPGYNVTLKAVLINTLTKTNVVSGKYIFKVDGVRVPLAVNDTQIYTMKIVDNAVALWTYTLPENIAKGIHDVTLAYNGNTQSNPVKYTSKALTVF